ncbi:MAG: tRNA (guanosine(37)-N1)-methyltransferase TrmD [Vicinamibacteria bacterium]|nr:tRNA (guanosine(37)-N1)-methyltransferase TrmD [Vicinamibacteria bacterium]
MPLRIDVITIFPDLIRQALAHGIVARAIETGLAEVHAHDLRIHTSDRRRRVDDAPFGGGPGMVMQAEPFFRAVEAIMPEGPAPSRPIILLSPRGEKFTHRKARDYSNLERLILLCGRYEGIDERVRASLATAELSLGDFVLMGGEVPALAVIEASVRLIPGALGDAESSEQDSFENDLLDHPHYTRPADFRGLKVPEVLLSGDHAAIAQWRRNEAAIATDSRRPDLRRN